MASSGLVEIASHTYDLHHGIVGNPQSNLQPAATTREYDAATGRYEGDANWRARVNADLAKSASVIERETGRRPRVIVWPYGSYNDELVHMAGALGMSIALTLDDGANTADVPLTALRRTLIEHNPTLADFIAEVRGPRYPPPVRVVEVSLDDVYNADPAQQEKNLSALLDRMEVLRPTHVYVKATAGGDGSTGAAYFPTRHLPLRADLFNRVEWQLATRDDVKVFAVMPVSVAQLPPEKLAETYEDLARHAHFDGLVFDDKVGPGGGVDAAGSLELTRQLALRARAFRAPLKTVRTATNSENVAEFAAAYDYVALPTRDGLVVKDPVLQRKVVIMLPNSSPPGDRNVLARRMRALQLRGTLNFGYGPDDFMHNNPPLAQIAPVMSLRVYPQAPTSKEK
jgi:biofilm PGA synthesis lipoprotein PgaB